MVVLSLAEAPVRRHGPRFVLRLHRRGGSVPAPGRLALGETDGGSNGCFILGERKEGREEEEGDGCGTGLVVFKETVCLEVTVCTRTKNYLRNIRKNINII